MKPVYTLYVRFRELMLITRDNRKSLPVVFSVCWFSYASAYLCRINFVVTMSYLSSLYGWDKIYLGMVAGGFFWAYACGQLINGIIGDRFSSRWFVGLGLACTGIMNLLIPFAGGNRLLIFWTANGFFQSMLWGPILRTVTSAVGADNQTRSKIAAAMSTSFVVGSFAAYSILGRIVSISWQMAFWIPGLIMLLCSVVWIIAIPKQTRQPVIRAVQTGSFRQFVMGNGLLLNGILCLFHGVIKESITVWGPTFLSEVYTMPYQYAVQAFALIPIMNFIGVLFSGWLNKKYNGQYSAALSIFFIVSGIGCGVLLVTLGLSFYVTLALMSLLSALMLAVNSTLLAFLPMKFSKENRVSGVAGYFDFNVYMGAAAVSPLTGLISDNGWHGVFILWIIICCAAVALAQILKIRYDN